MISQSWDGKRLYITSSLLAHWDQEGRGQRAVPARLQLGRPALTPAFEVDFTKDKLGRPHHMKFTAKAGQSRTLAALARQ